MFPSCTEDDNPSKSLSDGGRRRAYFPSRDTDLILNMNNRN